MDSNSFRAALIVVFLFGWIGLEPPLGAQPLSVIPIQPGDLDPATTKAPDVPAVDSIDGKIHAQLRAALDAGARGVAFSAATANLPKALRNAGNVLVEVRFADTANDAADVLQRHGATLRHSMGRTMHEASLRKSW